MDDTEVRSPFAAWRYPEAVRFVPEALPKAKEPVMVVEARLTTPPDWFKYPFTKRLVVEALPRMDWVDMLRFAPWRKPLTVMLVPEALPIVVVARVVVPATRRYPVAPTLVDETEARFDWPETFKVPPDWRLVAAVRFVPEALVKEKVVMVPMFIVPEAAFSSDDDTTPRLDTCR